MKRRSIQAPSRLASFRYAFQGVSYLLRTQPNARIHAVMTVAVVALGLWLRVGRLEWAILMLATGLVWMAEFVNTAVEAAFDLASPEHHPLAKTGKDTAAAGVLVAAIAAVAVGLLILGPPIWVKVTGG